MGVPGPTPVRPCEFSDLAKQSIRSCAGRESSCFRPHRLARRLARRLGSKMMQNSSDGCEHDKLKSAGAAEQPLPPEAAKFPRLADYGADEMPPAQVADVSPEASPERHLRLTAEAPAALEAPERWDSLW